MSEKSEALRLARELEACPTINYKDHAAELRRLHSANAELLEALKQAFEECIWPNERLSDVHAKARAAIAKVEGRI